MNRSKRSPSRCGPRTARHWRVLAIVSATVTFVTYAGSGVVSTQQNAAAGKTVWDGAYTPAQAERGKKAFGQSCAPCHMENLQGDSADIPALVGDDFLNAWTDQSVDALFRRIQSTMPQDSPSSLSTQVYVDILTYILQSNKFPEGQAELKRDENLMKAIVIKKTK